MGGSLTGSFIHAERGLWSGTPGGKHTYEALESLQGLFLSSVAADIYISHIFVRLTLVDLSSKEESLTTIKTSGFIVFYSIHA